MWNILVNFQSFSRRQTTRDYMYLVMFVYVLLLWPWPWPYDLDVRTWPRYSKDVPAYQKLRFYAKAFKVRARTDRQKQTHATENITTPLSEVLWFRCSMRLSTTDGRSRDIMEIWRLLTSTSLVIFCVEPLLATSQILVSPTTSKLTPTYGLSK